MFLSFTKKISRQQVSFAVALLMLIGPAFIASGGASAQKKNTKAASSQKKNTKSTPAKKTQAKTAPTPKKNQNSKTKQTSKSKTETASKDKKTNKKSDRNSKSNAKSNDRNSKNKAKSNDRKSDSRRSNTKQTLAEKQRSSEKNSKNRRSKETLAKSSASRSTRTRTTERTTPKPIPTKTKRKTTVEQPPRAETTVVRTDATVLDELPQIIVSSNSVPVRSQAKVDAAPVSSVKLGTILKVTEKNPAWYKVQFIKDGKSSAGWISANAVNDLNAAQKEEIYRQIVERNFRSEMDFASAAELYEFLSGAAGELKASDAAADLEFKRLLALRAALKNIGAGQNSASPFREFLAARDQEIVYNEPAGEWLVVSNRFWDLHKKYQKSGISDVIAWEAANNPLPGECEGYVNCYLFDMRMRFGEYLNLHPSGRHSGEALKNLTDYLAPIVADSPQKSVYNGPTDVTDRAEFNNLIAELRTIVSRLSYIEKEKTLQQLRQIAEAYR